MVQTAPKVVIPASDFFGRGDHGPSAGFLRSGRSITDRYPRRKRDTDPRGSHPHCAGYGQTTHARAPAHRYAYTTPGNTHPNSTPTDAHVDTHATANCDKHAYTSDYRLAWGVLCQP